MSKSLGKIYKRSFYMQVGYNTRSNVEFLQFQLDLAELHASSFTSKEQGWSSFGVYPIRRSGETPKLHGWSSMLWSSRTHELDANVITQRKENETWVHLFIPSIVFPRWIKTSVEQERGTNNVALQMNKTVVYAVQNSLRSQPRWPEPLASSKLTIYLLK